MVEIPFRPHRARMATHGFELADQMPKPLNDRHCPCFGCVYAPENGYRMADGKRREMGDPVHSAIAQLHTFLLVRTQEHSAVHDRECASRISRTGPVRSDAQTGLASARPIAVNIAVVQLSMMLPLAPTNEQPY